MCITQRCLSRLSSCLPSDMLLTNAKRIEIVERIVPKDHLANLAEYHGIARHSQLPSFEQNAAGSSALSLTSAMLCVWCESPVR